MIWSLDLDDFTGKFCNEGKYPLLSAAKVTILQILNLSKKNWKKICYYIYLEYVYKIK